MSQIRHADDTRITDTAGLTVWEKEAHEQVTGTERWPGDRSLSPYVLLSAGIFPFFNLTVDAPCLRKCGRGEAKKARQSLPLMFPEF